MGLMNTPCPRCGSKVRASGARYCPRCGMALGSSADMGTQPAPTAPMPPFAPRQFPGMGQSGLQNAPPVLAGMPPRPHAPMARPPTRSKSRVGCGCLLAAVVAIALCGFLSVIGSRTHRQAEVARQAAFYQVVPEPGRLPARPTWNFQPPSPVMGASSPATIRNVNVATVTENGVNVYRIQATIAPGKHSRVLLVAYGVDSRARSLMPNVKDPRLVARDGTVAAGAFVQSADEHDHDEPDHAERSSDSLHSQDTFDVVLTIPANAVPQPTPGAPAYSLQLSLFDNSDYELARTPVSLPFTRTDRYAPYRR